jgi:hypothetical protein
MKADMKALIACDVGTATARRSRVLEIALFVCFIAASLFSTRLAQAQIPACDWMVSWKLNDDGTRSFSAHLMKDNPPASERWTWLTSVTSVRREDSLLLATHAGRPSAREHFTLAELDKY